MLPALAREDCSAGLHPLSLCPNRRGLSLAGCRFAYGQQGAPQDKRLRALLQGSPRNCALHTLQSSGLALLLLPKAQVVRCLQYTMFRPSSPDTLVLGSERSLKSLHPQLFPKQSFPFIKEKDHLRESLGMLIGRGSQGALLAFTRAISWSPLSLFPH